MPAIRSSLKAKPVKYERTHEENQERAYIAASRRSDRCLEARMESARRASVIHERRTGRALRITECEVVNEEMYEEVNDLSAEYRRLNAHLQPRSVDFDRRLLAYLSSQIATREAVADLQNQQSGLQAQFVNSILLQEPPMHTVDGTLANHRGLPYTPASLGVNSMRQDSHTSLTTPYAKTFDQHCSMSRIGCGVEMAGSPYSQRQFPQHHMHKTNPGPQPWQATSIDPLSATLPLHSQHILSGCPPTINPGAITRSVNSPTHHFGDRRYSYNPNGRSKTASNSPPRQHYPAFVNSGQASSSSSPPPFKTTSGSKPSTSHGGGVPSQAFQDLGEMGADASFTRHAPQQMSEAVIPGNLST